jgi:hypothetical protein
VNQHGEEEVQEEGRQEKEEEVALDDLFSARCAPLGGAQRVKHASSGWAEKL